MLEEKPKYDAAIYGDAGAEFLDKLDNSLFPSFISVDNEVEEEERRQELIRDMKEGKLSIIGH